MIGQNPNSSRIVGNLWENETNTSSQSKITSLGTSHSKVLKINISLTYSKNSFLCFHFSLFHFSGEWNF